MSFSRTSDVMNDDGALYVIVLSHSAWLYFAQIDRRKDTDTETGAKPHNRNATKEHTQYIMSDDATVDFS